MHIQSNPNIHGHKTLPIKVTSHKKLQKISAFGPLAVSGTSHSQTSANPTVVPQSINRSSQDSRQRTTANTMINTPINIQSTTDSCTQLAQSKKYSTIERCFKEEKFSSAAYQWIGLILWDFHICANSHSLTSDEHFQLVVNCFKGGAFEFYLRETYP